MFRALESTPDAIGVKVFQPQILPMIRKAVIAAGLVPLPPLRQGPAEGDVAHRGPTRDPVRGRGGGRSRHH